MGLWSQLDKLEKHVQKATMRDAGSGPTVRTEFSLNSPRETGRLNHRHYSNEPSPHPPHSLEMCHTHREMPPHIPNHVPHTPQMFLTHSHTLIPLHKCPSHTLTQVHTYTYSLKDIFSSPLLTCLHSLHSSSNSALLH
jgi:hypothetical protein